MKSLKSSGKPRRPKLLVRQVVGDSMLPTLREGRLVIASGLFREVQPGQMVIVRHQGLEKIKRIYRIDGEKVFVLGDNPEKSTDSRSFGWLSVQSIIARVIWPRG